MLEVDINYIKKTDVEDNIYVELIDHCSELIGYAWECVVQQTLPEGQCLC